MTESIVSAVSRFLTPELVGKMASASGLDGAMTQKAVNASVPAILGGFANLASKPDGARQLANAVAEQPAGVLSSLASTVGGSAQLADKGGSLLSSLLGGGTVGSLVSGVSKSVGAGEGSTRTLMGLLGPIVLGVLGRQQRADGLDAGGLARMLTSQKDQISAAMPAGLKDLMPNLQESLGTAQAAAKRTFDFPRAAYDPPPAAAAIQRMVSDPKIDRSRAASWPVWLLPLLALAGLIWYLLPVDHARRQAVNVSPATPTQPASLLSRTGAQPTYIAKAPDNATSLDGLRNQDIYSSSGEKLGTLKDLVISPDGQVRAAVLSIGRFLGLGEKDIAVPFSAVAVERRNGGVRLSINATKDALQSAPAYDQAASRIRINAPKLFGTNPNGVKPDATTPTQGVAKP